MDVKEIRTRSGIDAVVDIPGSKSYTNRALVCASLAEGESVLENFGYCDDTLAMKIALQGLGAEMYEEGGTVFVDGSPGNLHEAGKDIYTGGAGTAMRFLTGLCTLTPGRHRLVGLARMHERPIKDLVDALGQIIDGEIYTENEGCPPVNIFTQGLEGGDVKIRTDSSSQYLSSLLMAAPYAREDVAITTIGRVVELPYMYMTLETMRSFGVFVKDGRNTLVSRQKYRPTRYMIESDASGGVCFMGAAAVTGGKVAVGRFREDSKQGDLVFANILEGMGCSVERK